MAPNSFQNTIHTQRVESLPICEPHLLSSPIFCSQRPWRWKMCFLYHVLSCLCDFTETVPFAQITLPHLLPGFTYSFNKIQFKCHCLQEAFRNPLLSAPTTPACFPWVTMVCLLVCFSPKADLPWFTWFTFVLPLLGILPGTQETVNKCMNEVFRS